MFSWKYSLSSTRKKKSGKLAVVVPKTLAEQEQFLHPIKKCGGN